MKNKILLMGLCLLAMACSDETTQDVAAVKENNVLLLKVDLLTYAFEGGKEFTFEDAQAFTIATEYQFPGDFGGIKLKYQELDAPLFEGTIHWSGLGQMTYPQIDAPSAFASSDIAAALPDESLREIVEYTESPLPVEWPYAPDFNALWNAVDNLTLVKEYRQSNPNAKVNLFLYTPSVGVGDPADWDWFVILKN